MGIGVPRWERSYRLSVTLFRKNRVSTPPYHPFSVPWERFRVGPGSCYETSLRTFGVSESRSAKDSKMWIGVDRMLRSFRVVPVRLWRADVVLTSRPAGFSGNDVGSSLSLRRSGKR